MAMAVSFGMRHVAGRVRSLLTAKSTLTQSMRMGSSIYKADPSFKPAHMDEMPVPDGPWKVHYKRKQRAYNAQLIAGTLIFAFTINVIVKSNKIFFNFYPPPLPGVDEELPTFDFKEC